MTNNSNLSPQAAANLEAHRKKDGQFGAHNNTSPEAALPAQPAAPVTATLTLQAWDQEGHGDQAIDLTTEEVDVRQFLDAMHVEDIDVDDYEGCDDIYYNAAKAGIVDYHPGPFTLSLDADSVEEYIAERTAAGQEDPISTREPRMSTARADKVLADMTAAKKELNHNEFEAGRAVVANIILERFPTATGATIYNSVEDDGEVLFEVETITGPGDEVLWAVSQTAGDTDEGFMEAMQAYSECLDRKGDDVLSTGIQF